MTKKSLILCLAIASTLLGCEQKQQTKDVSPIQVDHAESSSKQLASATQDDIDTIAATLNVKYRLVTNIPSQKCDKKVADGQCFEVELNITAAQAIHADNWQIYFSHIAPIQSLSSEEFTLEHINGDLHRIALTPKFKGFSKGETKKIVFHAMFWSLSEYDAMPNYLITADNLTAKVVESTKTAVNQNTGMEYLPFVETYTDANKQFKRTKNDNTQWLTPTRLYQRNAKALSQSYDVSSAILPTPKSVVLAKNHAQVDLTKGFHYTLTNLDINEVNVAINRIKFLGVAENKQGIDVALSIKANSSKKMGSYQLTVSPEMITVEGVDAAGVFNGLQSLASLISLGKNTIPALTVIDEPHYAFRGMLVDVARNFHSKAFILSLLDQMAAYKLNKLHLHLGDDEGWRLEIPSLPELTNVGSKRCFDSQEQDCLISQLGAGIDEKSSVNGYYSVSDYQEILQAATARHIQVIPSLDMPGHSRAAIKAMTVRYNKYKALEDDEKANQFRLHDLDDKTQYSSVQFYNDNTINACLESSYAFVEEVMKQVKKIHQQAGQPLTRYHIGADETAGAWVDSPVCKTFIAHNDKGVTDAKQLGAYFIERVAGILSDLDIETAGWSDGLAHTKKSQMPRIVQANAWDVLFWGGHEKVHELANRNWQIVVSSPDVLYFDFPYEADPKEHGYYWASRHTNTEKVFQFMPDNLPIHAEFWLDRQDNQYVADDTKKPIEQGKQFFGIQGQLWSENTRTDNRSEYKIFPRLLALAERAWYFPQWAVPYKYQGAKYSRESHVFTEDLRQLRDQKWQLFAQTLGKKELPKLTKAKVSYRLPTIGAVIKAGKLYANIAFPGIAIEYKDHTQAWKTYHIPVTVSGDVQVRASSADGKRKGRITQVIAEKVTISVES